MRDLRTRLTRSRQARRVALALLIISACPAMAEQPQGHLLRMMPPLPLQSISSTTVRSNPFCDPENLTGGDAIQLASGSGSIRLKPVVGEVGLHTIQDGTDQPPAPSTPVDPVAAPSVHQNPLVKSTHHFNADLVEMAVIDSAVVGPKAKPAREPAVIFRAPSCKVHDSQADPQSSSIVLIPPTATNQQADEVNSRQELRILSPAAKIRPADNESNHLDAAEQQPETARARVSGAETQDSVAQPVDPIVFSLSDRLETDPTVTESYLTDVTLSDGHEVGAPVADNLKLPEPVDEASLSTDPTIVQFSDELVAPALQPLALESEMPALTELAVSESEEEERNQLDSFARVPQPSERPQEREAISSGDAEGKIELSVVKPITIGQPEDEPSPVRTSPYVSSPAVTIHQREPNLIVADKPAEASLHTQRYRPPVAVTPVPITYQRSEIDSEGAQTDESTTVHSVGAMNLAGSSSKRLVASSTKLTPLYMKTPRSVH